MTPIFKCLICRKDIERSTKTFWKKKGHLLCSTCLDDIEKNKNHSPCVAGSRFVEIFPDGVVRGCEVEKLWDISTLGKVENQLDIVDILNNRKSKEFSKFAKNCSCTFECANAISTVYDTRNWPSLL